MTNALRRLVPAAAAIAGLATWWLWPRDPALLTPRDDVAAAHDAAAQRATVAIGAAAPATARIDASEPASAAPATYPYECTFTARDEYHLPVRAKTALGPDDGAMLPYSSGFELADLDRRHRWSAAASQGALVVGNGLLRRIVLQAGRPVRIATGAFLEPPSPSGEAPAAELDGKQLDRVFGPRIAPLVAFANESELIAGGIEIGVSGPGRFPIARTTPLFGVLHGTVLAPSGEPARDFVVRISDRAAGDRLATTGEQGAFAFKRQLAGTYRVVAGTHDGATLETDVAILEGMAPVTLRLLANSAVRGRVLTPDGAPLSGARLVWTTDLGDYNDHVVTPANGTFVVPARNAGAGTLWACAPGRGARWPAASCGALTELATDLVVDPAACRGSLRVAVPALEGFAPRTVSARLWQQASGFGMRLVCTRADERGSEFAAIDLPAGHYRVELLAPAFGVVDGGTFWCDGERLVDLGRVALPPLCDVTVELPAGAPEPSAYEFVRVSSAFPSRLHTELGITAVHRLAPGDYELWWRHGVNAPPRSRAFTIARGATALVLHLGAR